MADRLREMRAFVAVCDANGFAPAARRMGVAPSVVTRLIAGLELDLGVVLLHRTTRAIKLTDAGARFLEATDSLSPLWRQRPDRYAIRAGRNLPDKEFRYLRTVIVTAAVYRGFDSMLLLR